MGLDLLGLYTVEVLANRRNGLKSVLTLGRQEIHAQGLYHDLKTKSPIQLSKYSRYCEPLLIDHFGASTVDSLDRSNFEGANVIHDLNEPLPNELASAYDTLLDLGTLEHVMDVEAALENVARAVRVGGAIAHVVPSNGCPGHGLYQFSPQLFHSYYAPQRGFRDTEVYVATLNRPHLWYQVPMPAYTERVNIGSRGPMYVICLTTKASDVDRGAFQQSDYVDLWASRGALEQAPAPLNSQGVGVISRIKQRAKRSPFLIDLFTLSQAARNAIWADVPLKRLQVRELLSERGVLWARSE